MESESFPNLIPLFEAKSKVNELKALLLGAPQDVAWLQVCVHVAFVVQEGQGFQDVAGAVLDHPHGAALVAGVQQQLRHADIQQLQQQAAGRAVGRVVVGEHAVQSHCSETGWKPRSGATAPRPCSSPPPPTELQSCGRQRRTTSRQRSAGGAHPRLPRSSPAGEGDTSRPAGPGQDACLQRARPPSGDPIPAAPRAHPAARPRGAHPAGRATGAGGPLPMLRCPRSCSSAARSLRKPYSAQSAAGGRAPGRRAGPGRAGGGTNSLTAPGGARGSPQQRTRYTEAEEPLPSGACTSHSRPSASSSSGGAAPHTHPDMAPPAHIAPPLPPPRRADTRPAPAARPGRRRAAAAMTPEVGRGEAGLRPQAPPLALRPRPPPLPGPFARVSVGDKKLYCAIRIFYPKLHTQPRQHK